jgi:hypothetical protein
MYALISILYSWTLLSTYQWLETIKLYESAISVLRNAKEVEVFSIDPTWAEDSDKYKDPKIGFQERKPLGKTLVKDVETADKIKKEVFESLHILPKLERTLCFIPRHGLRVKTHNDTLDMLICFQCKKVHIVFNGKPLAELAIRKDSQVLFNDILKAAKVPLADGAEPDEKDKKDK